MNGKPPGKPPAGKGNKSFLGEDLAAELDAWDATFDALHSGPEEGGRLRSPDGPASEASDPYSRALREAIDPGGSGRQDGAAAALARQATIAEVPDDDEPPLLPAIALPDEDDLAALPADAPDLDEPEFPTFEDPPLDAPALELELPVERSNDRFDRSNDRSLDRLGSEFDADAPERESPPAARMTLDRALEDVELERSAPRLPAVRRSVSLGGIDLSTVDDPLETDFSDLQSEVRGAPAPDRGELRAQNDRDDQDEPRELVLDDAHDDLGEHGRPTPAPRDDDAASSGRAVVRRPPSDDDVYTSASRPNTLMPGGVVEDDNDRVVPPPPPEPRRGPAIIRRTPRVPSESDVPRALRDELTPPHGHDMSLFAQQTLIADVDELEAIAASQSAPSISPVDYDAYDDIEIADEDGAGVASGVPVAPASDAFSRPGFSSPEPSGRRTAHVLRRAETPTRVESPSRQYAVPALDLEARLEPRSPLGAVIEMDADEEPSAPAAEDDFSDVAAAVGADAEVPESIDSIGDPSGDASGDSRELPRDLSGDPSSDSGGDPMEGLDDSIGRSSDLGLDFESDLHAPSAASELDDALDDLDDLDDALAVEVEESIVARRVAGPPRPPPKRTPPPIAPPPEPDPDEEIDEISAPDSPGEAGEHERLVAVHDALRARTPFGVQTLTGIAPLASDSGDLDVEATRELAAAAPAPVPRRPTRRLQTPHPFASEPEPELEPALDLDVAARAWPEQVPPLTSAALDEAWAAPLLVYEREVATIDDSAASAALRIEAGRLSERLADLDRARTHYDAALLADPRATAALRGLRRIARAGGDLGEATRQLDSEMAVAGALERRPLLQYRIDLLMASGEQDLARVAVGELLDAAPSDVRALLAHLELAFVDGRADEFGIALEQLAHAVTDAELRAAAQSARGALAAHHRDPAAAMSWFAAAAEADPGALAARLGAVRYAAAQSDGAAAATALLDLARQLAPGDPATAAAAALRAQQWAGDASELGAAAAQLAASAMPSDPLVARLIAETSGNDPVAASAAFGHWAACATAPAERAYAAARAAELDAARGAELWATVLALAPGDDYAAAQLRTAHVAAGAIEASIDVDIAVATDVERDRARLRAAYGLIAAGKLDAAITLLLHGRALRPRSLAIAEALGEALAAAGNWTERAKLFTELATEPGDQLDREVAQLRSALAWEEAVGAATAVAEIPPGGEELPDLPGVIAFALEAWERVIEQGGRKHAPVMRGAVAAGTPAAHAATITLASRLGDRDALADVLARAQAAERSPWAAASLGLRRARLYADDPQHAESILRELAPADDPRRTVGLVMSAARRHASRASDDAERATFNDLGDAAAALEERSRVLDERTASSEIAALRLRAAQLALDAGDAPRATRLLGRVEQALPTLGVVPDLLAAARRRAGDRPTALAHVRRSDPPPGASSANAFARIVRDADLAAADGDGAAALALYQRALELHPGDPLATVPLIRTAAQLRDPAPVTSLALAQLRAAEDAGDGAAKAAAYELLAHIDAELRADPESAQVALESAARADPNRLDLMHRLERHYAVVDDIGELVRLREAALAAIPAELARDRAALLLDLAGLATRANHTEQELAALYRRVLASDPNGRLALHHLESIVRRAGFSEELAALEEKIAAYFGPTEGRDGHPRTHAAFWTRAGETFAELGQIDAALERFSRAETALPGHTPALEGWRQAALKGERWIDVAEAAARQAATTADPKRRGALHHFAGVALMDKALEGGRALGAFQHAIEADPGHRDAFIRLRILLEEDANHDELAALLGKRLEVEPDHAAKIELHRALADLHRNFLSDRDTAKAHQRAILEDDPNDLRAHAAISDIAWEQGNWQEAADALMARARLEREPGVLRTLCFRLGLIYADRLAEPQLALKSFQRALTFQPDDIQTLVRLADLAAQVGEYKLALGACERLVKNEADPDLRAAHLHRVARIFKTGFGDLKRAERALNLALDTAPTNDDALQELVQFYKDARDITSVRVHLNRVTGAMRSRVQHSPLEGVPYRVIARAMAARGATGVPGSQPIARAAAQLADLLGAAGEPEQKLLMASPSLDLALLVKPDADDVLFPRGVPLELRQIFQLLGDRIAKHVGVDLRPYGATRGDRLRARDNPVAAVAQSVATALGFGEIDVYVSTRQPWAMVAEPTSPVSLIVGSAIANTGGDGIRFAAGGALKLAQTQLALLARLPADELGVLVVALMRLFQPDFPLFVEPPIDPRIDPRAPAASGPDPVAAQLQKLRRLIPTGLLNELRPYGLAIDGSRFNHYDLARDLRVTGLRAGLVASGSLLVGLRILAGQTGGELPGFVTDPIAHDLIGFALSEDHAAVAR